MTFRRTACRASPMAKGVTPLRFVRGVIRCNDDRETHAVSDFPIGLGPFLKRRRQELRRERLERPVGSSRFIRWEAQDSVFLHKNVKP